MIRTLLTSLFLAVALGTIGCGGCSDDSGDGDGKGSNTQAGSCDPVEAGCDEDAICDDRGEGDFFCYCPPGYQGDGQTCVELGACDDDPSVCGDNAFCAERSAGSFCVCEEGFEGDGFTCENVDECARFGEGVCGIGTCVDGAGDFTCDCPDGYDGIPCEDIDECTDVTDICGAGTCTNEEGSHVCDCEFGYEFDGTTCADIDECAMGTHNCRTDDNCQNEPGSFRCGCPQGYTGDGDFCTILADCQNNPSACDENASCQNSPDGDTCVCDVGWAGDGASCEEAGWSMLSAGSMLTCGVREDRTLWCWGADTSQLLDVSQPDFAATPIQKAPQKRFRMVDVGKRHACALAADGTVWCWGDNRGGALGQSGAGISPALEQVGTDDDWESVAVSHMKDGDWGFSCAVKTDGTLWCWGGSFGGFGPYHEPEQMGDDSNWMRVEANETEMCALKFGGTLWCGLGQPQQVEGEWTDFAMGEANSCGVRTDGSMWCFDGNPGPNNQPWEISGNETWIDAAAGRGHVCGVRSDGVVYCLGEGDHGQIGRITLPGSTGQWQQLPGGGTYIDVVAGDEHTCAITDDRRAECWGRNLEGQLGTGSAGTTATPVEIPGANGWTDVSVGARHACALDGNGVVHCWGDDTKGAAGGDSLEHFIESPTQLWTTPYVGVSAGANHSCATASDSGGQIRCWGSNANGQLGLGDYADHEGSALVVGNETDWTDVSAGGMFTCGVRSGQVHCWGKNDQSQLGLGNTADQNAPVALVETSGIATVSTSTGGHACAIGSDGALYCWGDDTQGQLGNGFDGSQTTAQKIGTDNDWATVSTGFEHTCAVKGPGSREGLLYCWGSNSSAQLGTGTPGQGLGEPDQVTIGGGWKYVSAGKYNTCAIKDDDNKLTCWGHGDLGQLGTGSYQGILNPSLVSTGWVDVSVGDTATCAIKQDQSMWCWGHGAGGILGPGTAFSTEALEVAVPSF